MLGITYDTWNSVCDMYFNLSKSSQKSYLQWFPFSKLSLNDKKEISSENFYNKYIKDSSFVFLEESIYQTEHYIQKSDGSFRNASLISPMLYLIFQAVGKEIHSKYKKQRQEEISVYYAGNYNHIRPKYKKDYHEFFKKINLCKEDYEYFIKTDVSNFFDSISINKLLEQIDKVCNKNEVIFSQIQLLIFKEFLLYCGNGNFPLIETSMASSFLATVIYFDEIDRKLYDFISEHNLIKKFKIIRYVDDMYILISLDCQKDELYKIYNDIFYEYSSILKEWGLSINSNKCCIEKISEINNELKKSLYDEYVNNISFDIEELFSDSVLNFFEELYDEYCKNIITNKKYTELIEKHFSNDKIKFTANEVFNYFVYKNNDKLLSEPVVKQIIKLLKHNDSFLKLDSKRLTTLILKIKDGSEIKKLLNNLFIVDRTKKWNSYNTLIAITYLIQRNFVHKDLIKILEKQEIGLYKYYENNCKHSFNNYLKNNQKNKIIEIIQKEKKKEDKKIQYLYFMYIIEYKRSNYMTSFAYYKNYFDRIAAHLEYVYDYKDKMKEPNYKKFYGEQEIKKLYSSIINSDILIQEAHKLRNSNPISHSSSELLDKLNSDQLKDIIKKLDELVKEYINLKNRNS